MGWRTLCFKEHFTQNTHFACYILLKRTVCFKLACYSLLFNTLYPSTHFASWNVFLLSTVCFSTPFAPQNTLLLNTLCFSAHSAPQNTLLLSTLCFKEHFTPRNTLLLNTLCFLTPFAPWNTLLLRTLCFLTPFAPWNTFALSLCTRFSNFGFRSLFQTWKKIEFKTNLIFFRVWTWFLLPV